MNLLPIIKKNHFLQSYEWGVFKSKSPDWSFDAVGLEDQDGNLVAGALVLIRFLPIIKRPFLYIPRGYIIDFEDKKLLETFTKAMHQYAKSKKAIFIKLDPDIKYVDRNVDGEKIEGALENNELIQTLNELGYRHLGFTQDFDSSIQPRYTFRLDLTPSEKELLQGCQSKHAIILRLLRKKELKSLKERKKT